VAAAPPPYAHAAAVGAPEALKVPDAIPLRRAPAIALDRLPPGTRAHGDAGALVWTRGLAADPDVLRRVEIVPNPDADDPSEAWLEVTYTIDPTLDARVREILTQTGVARGHVIVMDPATGEVLAYVSTDPDGFPATRAYPAASLMKIVTAAALLEKQPDFSERRCSYRGSPYLLDAPNDLPAGGSAAADPPETATPTVASPAHEPPATVAAPEAAAAADAALDAAIAGVEPPRFVAETASGDSIAEASREPAAPVEHVQSFRNALAISNNQCFARFAVEDLGAEALLDEIARSALLDPPGALHDPGRFGAVETDRDLGSLGSGLAGSFVTPLAAARLAALLAGGERVTPHWVASVRDARGNPLAVPGGAASEPAWTPEVAAELRDLLVSVTTEGTARRAFTDVHGEPRLGPVKVAGKTGTLHGTDPEGRYRWFIGVAPADAPRIALATVVVDAEDGPSDASRVALATFEEIFCDAGSCGAAGVEPLLARAQARADDGEVSLARAEELDEPPRPTTGVGFDFPRRLLRKSASGQIELLVTLDPDGHVLDVAVESSTLPEFDELVSAQVRDWTFTPPRQRGRPVVAQARLPIPIRID